MAGAAPELKAPVVWRLRWKPPSPRTLRSAANHVRYIATRPGVAREEDELIGHAGYIANRPRSTGLFGPDGGEAPQIKAVMGEIETAKGPTWQMVLSLREDDAKTLNMIGLSAWQDLTRRVMPHFAEAIGVKPEQLRWVGAHHVEPGHPHVHVMAWLPDTTMRSQARLTKKELADVRRGVVSEVYRDHRQEILRERTALRDLMRMGTETDVQGALRLLHRARLEAQIERPKDGALPPRLRRPDLDHLARELTNLASVMPGHGRAALAFMPPEVKQQALVAADWILARPEYAATLASFRQASRAAAALYTHDDHKLAEAERSAYEDIRHRVAQIIVRGSATVSFDRTSATRMAQSVGRAAHSLLERERLRAEGKAELGRVRATEESEERAKRERARQMGIEH